MDDRQKQQNFLAMVERNKARMAMICRSYADDVNRPEDLMQDALLNLWKGYDSFRSEADESTWLYRVTLNSCLDTGRRNSHRVATVPLVGIDILQEDTAPDERKAALNALLGHLDQYEKAMILMRLDSLSYKDIAEILGISEKNVSVRLTRIRKKLRDLTTDLDLP